MDLTANAFEITEKLRAERLAHVNAVLDLAEAERNHTFVRAVAEQEVIRAAGDEKALGGNDTARARAFTIALSGDVGYQEARQAAVKAERTARTGEATIRSLEDELAVLLAAMKQS